MSRKRRQAWDRSEDLASILELPQGRRVFWEILVSARVFQSTMQGDPNWTAFSEGRRSIGLEILNLILEACPDRFLQMIEEAKERDAGRREGHGNDAGE